VIVTHLEGRGAWSLLEVWRRGVYVGFYVDSFFPNFFEWDEKTGPARQRRAERI
jgi:hypothetical protein